MNILIKYNVFNIVVDNVANTYFTTVRDYVYDNMWHTVRMTVWDNFSNAYYNNFNGKKVPTSIQYSALNSLKHSYNQSMINHTYKHSVSDVVRNNVWNAVWIHIWNECYNNINDTVNKTVSGAVWDNASNIIHNKKIPTYIQFSALTSLKDSHN